MAKLGELFPDRYLKAASLKGRDAKVTIDYLEIEKMGQSEDDKPVLYF